MRGGSPLRRAMEPPDFGRDDEFWGWHRAADVIVGVDRAALLINLMIPGSFAAGDPGG
jgi:hypothetical protein